MNSPTKTTALSSERSPKAPQAIPTPVLLSAAERPTIQSTATWDDLVLSRGAQSQLREIVAWIRNRSTLRDAWGLRDARNIARRAAYAALDARTTVHTEHILTAARAEHAKSAAL